MAWQDNVIRTNIVVTGQNQTGPVFNAVERDVQHLQRTMEQAERAMNSLITGTFSALTSSKGLTMMRDMAEQAKVFTGVMEQSARQLRSLPGGAEAASVRIRASVQKWSDALIIGRDQIATIEESWIRMGIKSEAEINRLMPIVADFAAVTKTSMVQAAADIGKAMKSPQDAAALVQKAGVDLTQNQQEMFARMGELHDHIGAFNYALVLMKGALEGGAATQRRLNAAQMLYDKSTTNLALNLGDKLLPTFEKVITNAASIADWMAQASPPTQRFQAAMLALATTAATVISIRSLGGLLGLLGTPGAGLIMAAGTAAAVVGGLTIAFNALGETAEERRETLNHLVENFEKLSGIKLPPIGDWLFGLEDIVVSPELESALTAMAGVAGELFESLKGVVTIVEQPYSEGGWVAGVKKDLETIATIANGLKATLTFLRTWQTPDTKIPESQGSIRIEKGGAVDKGLEWFTRQFVPDVVPAGRPTEPTMLPPRRDRSGRVIPGRQHGGHVTPRGTVVVGERGPELVNLPQGGSVLPHSAYQQQMQQYKYATPFGGTEEQVDDLSKQFKKLEDALEPIIKAFEKLTRNGGGVDGGGALGALLGGGGGAVGGFGGGGSGSTADVQAGAGSGAWQAALSGQPVGEQARQAARMGQGGGAGGPYSGGAGGTGGGAQSSFPNNAAGESAFTSNAPMTAQERNNLGLILKYESHGKNVMNYMGRSQGLDPATPKGYTAQGYYQMLNTNWRRLAPKLGIKTPNAMASSFEDQTRVALALHRESGIGNWKNFNPALRGALARGEQASGKFAISDQAAAAMQGRQEANAPANPQANPQGAGSAQDMSNVRQMMGPEWRKDISQDMSEVLRERQSVELKGQGQVDINLRGNTDAVDQQSAVSSGNLKVNLGRPTNTNIFRGGDPGIPDQQ